MSMLLLEECIKSGKEHRALPDFIHGSASLDPCKQMAEVCRPLSVAVLS